MMQSFSYQRPKIMGILNVTPDSFFDGGSYVRLTDALKACEQMIAEGVDIIDIGGESTRPGATCLSADEELARVQPVLEQIKRNFDVTVSIDTRNPKVMQACLELGADWINDVQAMQQDGSLDTVAQYRPQVCLMHMQGSPQTMQEAPQYSNVVEEVKAFLKARMQACLEVGIPIEHIYLDPGFGFGKTLQHNLSLLNHLHEFKALGASILVGLSRKSMVGQILDLPPEKRLFGTLSATSIAVYHGADVIRTHAQDIRATRECVLVAYEMRKALPNLSEKPLRLGREVTPREIRSAQ